MAVDPLHPDSIALSPTLAPLLHAVNDAPRAAFDKLASLGFRFVRLSASQPGFRPRELDQSARRDLLATLRRRELAVSGLDLWIPVADYLHPSTADRVVDAVTASIRLAGDLGRQPLSLVLPDEPAIVSSLTAEAERVGIALADHAVPVREASTTEIGIDPAAWLSHNLDPAAGVVAHRGRLVAARLSDLSMTGTRIAVGHKGDGRLDVLQFRVALATIGHQRPVVLDARQWNDPWDGIVQANEAWKATAAGQFPRVQRS